MDCKNNLMKGLRNSHRPVLCMLSATTRALSRVAAALAVRLARAAKPEVRFASPPFFLLFFCVRLGGRKPADKTEAMAAQLQVVRIHPAASLFDGPDVPRSLAVAAPTWLHPQSRSPLGAAFGGGFLGGAAAFFAGIDASAARAACGRPSSPSVPPGGT